LYKLTFHNLFFQNQNRKREGATLLWGKIYYIVDFSPGERLLYSSFPGGELLWGKTCYTIKITRCGSILNGLMSKFNTSGLNIQRWKMTPGQFSTRFKILRYIGEGLQNLGLCSALRAIEQGGIFFGATPTCTVTRDLGFSDLIRRTVPFSRLLRHAWGCRGSILTRILTGDQWLKFDHKE
jgi:hypothetical protein